METVEGGQDEVPNREASTRTVSRSKALPGSIFRRSKSGSYRNISSIIHNRGEVVEKPEGILVEKADDLIDAGPDNYNDNVTAQNLRVVEQVGVIEALTNQHQINDSNQRNSSGADTPQPAPAAAPIASTRNSKKKQRSYKESQFEKIITSNKIHLSELRTAAWNGVPPEYRSLTWKILLNYAPTLENTRPSVIQKKRNEYYVIVKKFWDDVPDAARSTSEQIGLRQVLVDIPRTLPDVLLFKNQRVRDMMARILYLYSLRNPSTGYVQGFNELLCPFVLVYIGGYFDGREIKGCECQDDIHERNEKCVCIECVSDEILSEVEADSFHALSILLSKIQTHYMEDQPGLQHNIIKLSKVVKRVDSALHSHLMDEGMLYQQMCFRWFHNFLLRETSINQIIRMWDTYLSSVPSGFENLHIFVCAAIIVQDSEKLRSMRLEDLFQYIQNMNYKGDVAILLSQAYVLSTLFDGNEAHLE